MQATSPSTSDILRIVEKRNQVVELKLITELKSKFRVDQHEARLLIQQAIEKGLIVPIFLKHYLNATLFSSQSLRDSREVVLRRRVDLCDVVTRSVRECVPTPSSTASGSSSKKNSTSITISQLIHFIKLTFTIKNMDNSKIEEAIERGVETAVSVNLLAGELTPSGCLLLRPGEASQRPLVCSVCGPRRTKPSHEKILRCKNCSASRHATCGGLPRICRSVNWECELCSTCFVCHQQESRSSGRLAWCVECGRPSHTVTCDARGREKKENADHSPNSQMGRSRVNTCTDCENGRKKSSETMAEKEAEREKANAASNSSTLVPSPICWPAASQSVPRSRDVLSDSLTRFFTPSTDGRTRRPAKAVTTSEDEEESAERAKKPMSPLTVDTSRNEAGSSKAPLSSGGSSGSHSRRTGQLIDSLSHYFSATSERRRTFQKGDYAQLLSKGIRQKRRGGAQSGHSESSTAKEEEESDEGEMTSPGRSPKAGKKDKSARAVPLTSTAMPCTSSPTKSNGTCRVSSEGRDGTPLAKGAPEWRPAGRPTHNSASAALFSGPDGGDHSKRKKKNRVRVESSSASRSPKQKRVRTPKIPHTPHQEHPRQSRLAAPDGPSTSVSSLSSQRRRPLKIPSSNEESDCEKHSGTSMRKWRQGGGGESAAPPSTPAAAPSGLAVSVRRSELKHKERKEKRDRLEKEQRQRRSASPEAESVATGASSSSATISTDVREWNGITISAETWSGFEMISKKADENVEKVNELNPDGTAARWPLTICLGEYEMETWFTAPYPHEYACAKRLFICEHCLKYMRTLKTLIRHTMKCDLWHPPGNEIYRKDDISVFEVDGNQSGIYCQNLCMLAKLYLDHKTLYYDVEPFLFYILTKNDAHGFHIVGYFSKEKYSAQKFNLSCIVTLPCYHKKGYGRFLIDFSFMLSRREGLTGTPERPLSDLGRVSYAAYWKSALLEWMHDNLYSAKSFTINDMSQATGISVYDVVEVLEALDMLQKDEKSGRIELLLKLDLIDQHWQRVKSDPNRIWIDENALKWSPTVYTPSKDYGIRSPQPNMKSPTPHASPATLNNGVPVAAVGSTIKKGLGSDSAAARRALKAQNPAAAAIKNSATRQLKLTDIGFVAVQKQKVKQKKEERTDDSSRDEDSDHAGLKKNSSCKDEVSKKRGRHESSEDSSSEDDDRGGGGRSSYRGAKVGRKRVPTTAAAQPTVAGRKTAPRKGASNGTQRKAANTRKEGRRSEDDAVLTSSECASSSDSDADSGHNSFRFNGRRSSKTWGKGGRAVKGDKGSKTSDGKGSGVAMKKPPEVEQKTSGTPSVPRKKKDLKSPGKVFPPDYGKSLPARPQPPRRPPSRSTVEVASCSFFPSTLFASTQAIAALAMPLTLTTTRSRCSSVDSTDTMPMIVEASGAVLSPGGNRSLCDVSDDADERKASSPPSSAAHPHENEGKDVSLRVQLEERLKRPGSSSSIDGELERNGKEAREGRSPSTSAGGRARSRRLSSSGSEEESPHNRAMIKRRSGGSSLSLSSSGGSSSGSSSDGAAEADSPRPIGDRVPDQAGETVNMGGIPDEDEEFPLHPLPASNSRETFSSESERPPSLEVMMSGPVEEEKEEVAGPAEEIAAPLAQSHAVTEAVVAGGEEGAAMDEPLRLESQSPHEDDEAMPTLSPNNYVNMELEVVEAEEAAPLASSIPAVISDSQEKICSGLSEMDRPPKAPAPPLIHSGLDDTDTAAGHSHEMGFVLSSSCAVGGHLGEGCHPLHAPPLQHVSALNGQPMAPCSLGTPHQQDTPVMGSSYPGSGGCAHVTTPNSVPSAHNTPEMLLGGPGSCGGGGPPSGPSSTPFMSPPGMQQNICLGQQPSSVHSTHSTHDLSGGPSSVSGAGGFPSTTSQISATGHSNPSTPLRHQGAASAAFGSPHQPSGHTPPIPQPVATPTPDMRLRTMSDVQPATSLGPRRSSEHAASSSCLMHPTSQLHQSTSSMSRSSKRASGGGSSSSASAGVASTAQATLSQQQPLPAALPAPLYMGHYTPYPYAYQTGGTSNFYPGWTPAGYPGMGGAGYPAGMAGKQQGMEGMPPQAFHYPAYPNGQRQAVGSIEVGFTTTSTTGGGGGGVGGSGGGVASASWPTNPVLGPPFPGVPAVGPIPPSPAAAHFVANASGPEFMNAAFYSNCAAATPLYNNLGGLRNE